ncbi:MAG TPA: methionyl-tRNA formyltransferase, partial [Planctomycetaceae bacterium]|nr:methionyl-tRNA formyltransferase [Planctomycetaceae bacterium]
SGELHDRLAIVGADAFLQTLQMLESGTAKPLVQDDSLATKSPKISKAEGEIDWSKTSREIDCHIRAMQPWPNPFTFLHREDNSPERVVINEVMADHSLKSSLPGKIVTNSENRLLISTGDGVVEVKTLQPAGKKMMSAEEFLRGRPLSSGDHFGAES